MDEVLASGDQLTDRTRAIALYFTQAIAFWQDHEGTRRRPADRERRPVPPLGRLRRRGPRPHLATRWPCWRRRSRIPRAADHAMETSLGLFRTGGDRWGQAMALVMLGRVALLRQQVDAALGHFEESLALARDNGDELGRDHRAAPPRLGAAAARRPGRRDGRLHRVPRPVDAGSDMWRASPTRLEGLVAVAALAGDAERAGRLLGASRTLRERTGLHNAPAFSFHQLFVDRMLAAGERSPASSTRRSRPGGRCRWPKRRPRPAADPGTVRARDVRAAQRERPHPPLHAHRRRHHRPVPRGGLHAALPARRHDGPVLRLDDPAADHRHAPRQRLRGRYRVLRPRRPAQPVACGALRLPGGAGVRDPARRRDLRPPGSVPLRLPRLLRLDHPVHRRRRSSCSPR